MSKSNHSPDWNADELATLCKCWPKKNRPELQKLFPARSWGAIKTKAYIIGLGERNPECNDIIGFLDIETTDLDAAFGTILTYCIKKLNGPIIARRITLKDLYTQQFDKNLLRQFCKDVEQFTRVVVHYGGDYKFDIPMLRSRAIYWRLPFPEYKFCYVSDTHGILRKKFRFKSNRLGNVCKFYGIPSKTHPLDAHNNRLLITGNPRLMERAIRYTMTHNKEDVVALESLWKRISPFVPLGKAGL